MRQALTSRRSARRPARHRSRSHNFPTWSPCSVTGTRRSSTRGCPRPASTGTWRDPLVHIHVAIAAPLVVAALVVCVVANLPAQGAEHRSPDCTWKRPRFESQQSYVHNSVDRAAVAVGRELGHVVPRIHNHCEARGAVSVRRAERQRG
eukprot:5784802-Prymnesium_polylepis.1